MPETAFPSTGHRRAARRRRVVAAVGAAGLLVAGLVGAGGGTAVAAPGAAACSDTGATYATGLPPLPCLAGSTGKTRWGDFGQLLVPQGPANLFVGERRLARQFTLTCTNTGATASSCPATISGRQPPAATPSITAVQQIFIQSRPGYATQYGELARVPVSQPTAAGQVRGTIVLAQAATDAGIVRPVVARQSLSQTPYPEGTTAAGYEAFGPNPGPGAAFVQSAVAGSGPAVVTLINVTVDGEAVDTGSCRAAGTLRVSAKGGWTNAAPVSGRPAEYRGLTAPSYLHAKLSQVAATGCDGVDPAVVAVLLQNATFLQQVTIDFTAASRLTYYGCLTGFTSGCVDRHPATVNPAKVPATL